MFYLPSPFAIEIIISPFLFSQDNAHAASPKFISTSLDHSTSFFLVSIIFISSFSSVQNIPLSLLHLNLSSLFLLYSSSFCSFSFDMILNPCFLLKLIFSAVSCVHRLHFFLSFSSASSSSFTFIFSSSHPLLSSFHHSPPSKYPQRPLSHAQCLSLIFPSPHPPPPSPPGCLPQTPHPKDKTFLSITNPFNPPENNLGYFRSYNARDAHTHTHTQTRTHANPFQ